MEKKQIFNNEKESIEDEVVFVHEEKQQKL